MNLKNIHKLNLNEQVFVLNAWTTDPLRPLLESAPKLAPWLPDLSDDHKALLVFIAVAVNLGSDGLTLDRRVESAIRALSATLRAGADLARADGLDDTSPEVTRWEAAYAHLFPSGTDFLRLEWPEQVSATDRLLERAADPESPFQAVASDLNANGYTAPRVLALIQRNNDALRALVKDRLDDAATPAPVLTEATLRRRVSRRIRAFLAVLPQTFPPGSPELARLLQPLRSQLKP